MKILASPEFEAQRQRYALRFACEDCAHFEPDRASCSFDFPCADHRRARYRWPYRDVIFCKAFELM